MPASFITARKYGTVGPYTLLNTNDTALTATGSTETTPPAYHRSGACAVQAGYDTLYIWINNDIWISTDAGVTWSSDYTLANTVTPGYYHSALYIAYILGVPYLVGIYMDSVGFFRRIKKNLNTNIWSSELLSAFNVGSSNAICAEFLVNGQLYLGLTSDNARIHISLNLASDTFVVVGSGLMYTTHRDYITYNNKIYMIAPNASTTVMSLYEFSFGAYSLIGAIPAPIGLPANDSPHTNMIPVTFPSPVTGEAEGIFYTIYGYVYSGNPGDAGWLCAKIDLTGVSPAMTDVSVAKIPSSLLPVTAPLSGFGGQFNARFNCIVDEEYNISTENSPLPFKVWLYHADNIGTQLTVAEFPQGGGTLTPVMGPGPATEDLVVPNIKSGFGERFWIATENDVRIIGKQKISGAVRYSFKAFSSGSDIVSFKLYYNNGNKLARYIAKLTNPTATPPGPSLAVVTNNTITGIVADGTTVYTVDWDISSGGSGDGVGDTPPGFTVAAGDVINISPRIYT